LIRARTILTPLSYFADRSDKLFEYKLDSFKLFGVVRKEIPTDYGKGLRPVSINLEGITISVNSRDKRDQTRRE
jgi:hypothetical protein